MHLTIIACSVLGLLCGGLCYKVIRSPARPAAWAVGSYVLGVIFIAIACGILITIGTGENVW